MHRCVQRTGTGTSRINYLRLPRSLRWPVVGTLFGQLLRAQCSHCTALMRAASGLILTILGHSQSRLKQLSDIASVKSSAASYSVMVIE